LETLTAGRALIVAWIYGLLGTSYTPALAAWALFQVFFLLQIVRAARHGRRPQILLWASVWAYTLTVGLCSFLTRIDVRLTPEPGHVARSLLTGLKTFFLGRGPQEYMSPVLAVFVAIFFLVALTGRLGLIKWITAGWLLAVVYFSVTSAGYAPYDPVYTLYRSILLIPVMMLACWDSYLDFFKKFKQWKHVGPVLAVILCLAAAASTMHLYSKRRTSYQPSTKELFTSFLLNRAEAAGIRHQPAVFISETNQVTLSPIQGYGDYFFPLWQMSILTAENPKFPQPEQSQPLVIITDSEIAHKKFLPAGWTGTDEMTFLDSYTRRFPVRYGLYRYSGSSVTAFEGGHGNGKCQFENPQGIAVDNAGNIFVADTGNGRIQKFSPNGTFVASIATTDPNGIAIDRAGNIYVTEAGAKHRVQKLGPDGTFVAEWPPGLYGPRRIAIGPDDSIYVVDQGNTRIVKFSLGGQVLATFGSDGSGEGQFKDHTSVTVDPRTNKVYVADPLNKRIQVFDSAGRFLTTWPVQEWGQPFGFEDLAIDPKTDRLYASSAHQDSVLIFDLNGSRIGTLKPKPPDKLEGPSALALSNRKLYVLNMAGNRVSVIDL
jgi:DNA-binding beta-propeller fold protein YncE